MWRRAFCLTMRESCGVATLNGYRNKWEKFGDEVIPEPEIDNLVYQSIHNTVAGFHFLHPNTVSSYLPDN